MFVPYRNRNPFAQPFALPRHGGETLPVLASAFAGLWIAGFGMYADAAMTTPQASDGGVVKAWADQSPNGYHLTQAGADTISPVYRPTASAFNNRPALEFDGNDTLLRTMAGIAANSSTYTVYMVGRTAQATQGTTYSEASTASTTPIVGLGFNRVSTRVGGDHRSDAATLMQVLGNTGGNDNTARLYTMRRIGASGGVIRQNAVQTGADTDQPATTTVTRVGVGAYLGNTISNYLTGQLVFVGITLADDYATQEPLIAAYYGISI